MILYAKCYNYLKDYISYEDMAKKHGIETPKQITHNVSYFDINKDKIYYFGTARIGKVKRPLIESFFNKLKTLIKEN